MRLREPTTAWLPSTDEVFMAPERATLAALDANLQVAIRSLRAEYPGLDENGRLIQDPNWEPYVPPQVPLVEEIVGSAIGLHRLIARFRIALDDALGARGIVDGSHNASSAEEKVDIPV